MELECVLEEHGDAVCPICRAEATTEDSRFARLACSHLYHMHCIREWCRLSASCPMCRSPVRQRSEHCSCMQDAEEISFEAAAGRPDFEIICALKMFPESDFREFLGKCTDFAVRRKAFLAISRHQNFSKNFLYSFYYEIDLDALVARFMHGPVPAKISFPSTVLSKIRRDAYLAARANRSR